MKKMKKIFALLIAMVMVLGMSVTAMAATTVTIDPANPNTASSDPTYTYYAMMKASVDGDKVAYYVETQALATALDGLSVTVGDATYDLFTVTKASGADRWNVTINKKGTGESATDFTGEEVAAALQTIKSNAIKTGTAENNAITLDYDAYLLIESSLGTKLVLDTVTTKTIQEKNTYPTVTKTEDKSNAEIGQVITYTVPVVIPATVAEKAITLTDTITKGLTMNTAATVSGGVEDPAYISATWTKDVTTSTADAAVYTITIPAATVKANAGKTLTFTYTATVNENAVVKVAETNKVKLGYDNYTSVETEPVEVKTFGFDLLKIGDGNDENPLANVKFTLQNSSNEYYTVPTDAASVDEDRFVTAKSEVSTDAAGSISFAGLAQGNYTLTETETNTGYNLLSGPINVTIDENGNAIFSGEGASALEGNKVKINNQSGAVLPSTGGIGTTIFYIIGAILVIGAGVVLVTRRRMNVQ